MNAFGTILKTSREEKGLKLAEVFAALKIDIAIISKIERGERRATRKQVTDFIRFYTLNEQEGFSAWLSDKILYELKDEHFGLEALKVAESAVKYQIKKHAEKLDDLDSDITNLLKKVDALREQWQSYKPLNQIQVEKMQAHFNVHYTFESNRIEGNTLTMQETHLVVNEGLTVGGKSMREHLEAINHYEAIDFIMELVKNKSILSEKTMKEVHYLILKGIDRANAGIYRTVPVMISGSVHKPPQPYLLARKMEEVFEFYDKFKVKLHPVIMAADMHQKIVTVHPFIDGNGRTSRLMMNLILLNNGFTIANIKGDDKSRMSYYTALEQMQTENNSKAFYMLVLNATIESLAAHIELAGGMPH